VEEDYDEEPEDEGPIGAGGVLLTGQGVEGVVEAVQNLIATLQEQHDEMEEILEASQASNEESPEGSG
jgi:hypothetical protein